MHIRRERRFGADPIGYLVWVLYPSRAAAEAGISHLATAASVRRLSRHALKTLRAWQDADKGKMTR